MSVYPMHVLKETLNHKGGTKSFHLMEIVNAKGNAVLITRWGKTGTFGQFDVKSFTDGDNCKKAYSKKRAEKTKKGYMPTPSDMDIVQSEQELRLLLGVGYLSRFGADNLRVLDPNADTTGIRGPSVDYDEDGNKVDNAKRIDAKLMELAKEREAEEQRKREEEAYASNPMFGLF